MNVTEACHIRVLLDFLFTAETEADRDAAEKAAGYLAGRARTALGTGVAAEQAAEQFRQVFPTGWWELPGTAESDRRPVETVAVRGGVL
jgi:hypothetical protein